MKVLFFVDMINAFLHERGSFVKRGHKIINRENLILSSQKALALARKNDLDVVYTKVFDQNGSGPILQRLPTETQKLKPYQGWDADIISELAPNKGELVIPKNAYLIRPEEAAQFKDKDVYIGGVRKIICLSLISFQLFEAGAKLYFLDECMGDISEEDLISAKRNLGLIGDFVNLDSLI